MVRGKTLNELGDSWFSPKHVLAWSLFLRPYEVEILKGDGVRKHTHSYQTPNA